VILIPDFRTDQDESPLQVLKACFCRSYCFMILWVNKRGLMREWTIQRAFKPGVLVTVVVMIGLTLAALGISVRGLH